MTVETGTGAVEAVAVDETDVPSPCIKVCTLEKPARICIGCGRTIQEIAGWSSFSPAQKRAVLDRLAGWVPPVPA